MERDTLAAFAKHIRAAEPPVDTALLAQKWLAMNVTSVPVASVYPYVASDYTLMALRIGTLADGGSQVVLPTLEQPMDPQTFVYVMKNSEPLSAPLSATQALPSFAHFCDTIFPVPVGQEQWVSATPAPDDWKRKAYFLALHCGGGATDNAHFYDVVKAISNASGVASDTLVGREAVDDMYTMLNRYSVLKAMPATAADLGYLIGQCSRLTEEAVRDLEAAAPATTATAVVVAANEDDSALERTAVEIGFDITPTAEGGGSGATEAMQAYRRSVGLNATFSPQKIAKQMILAALAVPISDAALQPIIGQHQSELGKSVTAFPPFPSLPLDYTPLAAALQGEEAALDFIHGRKMGNLTPIQFLQGIVDMYGGSIAATTCGGDAMDARFKRAYLKKYPQPHPAIIKAIVNL